MSRDFGISSYRLKYFFIIVNTFAFSILILNTFSWAKDDCEKISDLDSKLACYDKQKAALNKSKDDFTNKLNSILSEKDKVNSQISSLSSKLTATASQINQIQTTLDKISKEIESIEQNLSQRKDTLDQKISVRDSVIKSYYYSKTSSDVEFIFGENENSLSNISLSLQAQEKINSQMVDTIKILNKEIADYESNKDQAQKVKGDLEKSYSNFLALKNNLTAQHQDLSGDLKDLKKQQSQVEDKLDDINSSIKKLSDKQQAILREKNGDGVTTSIGEYEQPDYKLPSPPFKPAFALMSYGAFSHYNGMSQYGALGRAKAGQSYTEILKFYYKVDVKTVSDFPKTISVKGIGTLDYKTYLYGIAEMPGDWPVEALKAQAIAARTYAYRSAKPICITEACQVYNSAKASAIKNGKYPNWKKAVDETAGMILDNPKNSQYSSTTGGYSNDSGWDLNGGAWPGSAFEKIAGSPWFYKAWYTQGYSTSSSTCGRSTPWLSERELTDILNSWVVWRKGESSDKDNISPVVNNCFGGNPYSIDKMKSRAEELGESYSSVSDVKVSIGSNGRTAKVTFTTNNGSVSIDGDVFKTVANLRAPGYISIKSRLWDIEVQN